MLPKEKGEGLTTQLIVESQKKITQMSPPPFLGVGSRAQIYTGSPLGSWVLYRPGSYEIKLETGRADNESM